MRFYTWDARMNFLSELANSVANAFSERKYNVFIFGSFIRDDYDPEKSDLDLAIYAEDENTTFEITEFISKYLNERNVKSSLVEIFTDQYDAYVAVVPLGLNVGFTDYFPEELKEYFYILRNRAIWHNEEEEYIKKVAMCVAESKRELGLT